MNRLELHFLPLYSQIAITNIHKFLQDLRVYYHLYLNSMKYSKFGF